jgi:hypothetical protein
VKKGRGRQSAIGGRQSGYSPIAVAPLAFRSAALLPFFRLPIADPRLPPFPFLASQRIHAYMQPNSRHSDDECGFPGANPRESA